MSEKLGRPIPVLENVAVIGPSVTEIHTRSADGARMTVVGSGGASGDVQLEGSSDRTNWYPLGPALSFAADDTQTIWMPEPSTYLRANVTAYGAGVFDANIQLYG
jgi:hypothetical protein